MKYSMRGNVDPFIVMDVMENARKAEEGGRKIIHMEVGQPSTAAPSGALERTSQIITSNPLGYTVALGLPELRKKNLEFIRTLVQFRYRPFACNCNIRFFRCFHPIIYRSF